MASTFKNAAVNATTAYQTLYTTPSATTTVILGVALANKTNNVIGATIQFEDISANSTYQIVNNVQIPGNTTLELLAGQKYILETGDMLNVTAEANSSIDVVMGLMESS